MFFNGSQVAFFSVLRVAATVLTIIAVRYVENRLDTSQPRAIGRAMLLITGAISASIFGFAISWLVGITLSLFLLIRVLRNIAIPLYTAWVNQKLDSQTRATVHSISGQMDAIGQIAGGPGVGLIANLVSVAAAIMTSGLLLSPAMLLVERANRQSAEQAGYESKAAD